MAFTWAFPAFRDPGRDRFPCGRKSVEGWNFFEGATSLPQRPRFVGFFGPRLPGVPQLLLSVATGRNDGSQCCRGEYRQKHSTDGGRHVARLFLEPFFVGNVNAQKPKPKYDRKILRFMLFEKAKRNQEILKIFMGRKNILVKKKFNYFFSTTWISIFYLRAFWFLKKHKFTTSCC